MEGSGWGSPLTLGVWERKIPGTMPVRRSSSAYTQGRCPTPRIG